MRISKNHQSSIRPRCTAGARWYAFTHARWKRRFEKKKKKVRLPLNQDLGSSRCDRAPPLNTVLHVMVQSINQSLSNLVGKLLYAPRGKTLCLAGKMLGAQGKSGVSPLLPSSFPKLEQGQFGCRSFIKEITLLSSVLVGICDFNSSWRVLQVTWGGIQYALPGERQGRSWEIGNATGITENGWIRQHSILGPSTSLGQVDDRPQCMHHQVGVRASERWRDGGLLGDTQKAKMER